jgi:hypothetical protein
VERERLVATWMRRQEQTDDAAQVRARVERRLARLKEVYLMGDLDPAEYQQRRTEVLAEREALPAETSTSEDVGRRLVGFLADLPSAWGMATPEERNRLAWQLIAEAVIENRTVVAVKPRPALLPFFESVNWCVGGSDGDRSRKRTFSPRRSLSPHCQSGTGSVEQGAMPTTRRDRSRLALRRRSAFERLQARATLCAQWPPNSASATRLSAGCCKRPDQEGSPDP